MAAYEMNQFKDEYQRYVFANAKVFFLALIDCGLRVAGDPILDFTETHQVVIKIGYTQGPEIARRLEDNHIICNYQIGHKDESFSAGALASMIGEFLTCTLLLFTTKLGWVVSPLLADAVAVFLYFAVS